MLLQLLALLLYSTHALSLDLVNLASSDGSCSPSSPCVSGCCSESGYCGFGPKYCGETCVSGCDALAQCGQYAAVPGQKCPLNVCCSEFGFCGTTPEFCDNHCQSGCDEPVKPNCSPNAISAGKRRIGYYESWSSTRECNAWMPSDIDASKWTHINYAFALIDPDTFSVAQTNNYDETLYSQLTNLKRDNPVLNVFISIGGWDAGGEVFSSMVSTPQSRAAFIRSLMSFMNTYTFDGVDIDWEYPVAGDRGGNKADFANFATFVAELRSAVGTRYGITVTLPSSYWYMQHFDLVHLEQSVDWFNIMTYDIHGTWDGNSPFTSSVVQAHTNLTEIDQALDLLWRNDVPSNKVVLGLGFYGRSFTLTDPACTEPGCPFEGGALVGRCTNTSGILSNAEIQELISDRDLQPVLDKSAAVKYMAWDENQWVSYDDQETFGMKMEYANGLCLGGTMVWALDLDEKWRDTAVDNLALSGNSDSNRMSVPMQKAVTRSNSFPVGLFWTPCRPPDVSMPCPFGYRSMVRGHGKVFDADRQVNTGGGCHGGGINGFRRHLCAANNVFYSKLQWGPGGRSKACNSKCPKGWTTISKNSHIAGQKSGCKSGKYAPLCAYRMGVNADQQCYSSSGSHLLSGGTEMSDPADYLDYFFVGGPHSRLLSRNTMRRSPRSKRRRLTKRQIHGGGCGGGLAGNIALEIPGTFRWDPRTYGNNYYTMEPTSIRSTAAPSSTTTSKGTITMSRTTHTTSYSTGFRTCDGARYPQACAHYASVAMSPGGTYSLASCKSMDVATTTRVLPKKWNSGHHSRWNDYIAKRHRNHKGKLTTLTCERDEWPPNHFQQGVSDGWVRFLPKGENAGIPNDREGGWRQFCKFPPWQTVVTQGGPISDAGSYFVRTNVVSHIITLNVMSYTWKNLAQAPWDPYLLTANKCRPSVLTPDVGYALMTNDWWYTRNGGTAQEDYKVLPSTAGKKQPTFRLGGDFRMVFDDGNASHVLSDEEMEALGAAHCNAPDCGGQLEGLRQVQVEVSMTTVLALPAPTNAVSTSSDVALTTDSFEATRLPLTAPIGLVTAANRP